MKIVFVASEVAPFAKTGGLADVAGSLPRALKQSGHDVRIVMPFYHSVEKGGFGIRKGRKSIELDVNGVLKKGLLRWTELDGIPVYLIEMPEYFNREHLYGPPGDEYPDNPERFGFFCRGILQLLKKMDFRPDIIHCNDWQTALIPVLLRNVVADDPFFEKTGSVLTIHNLAFQGIFPKEALAPLGLDWSFFTIDRLEYYDNINLMKGGILSADIVTTVSETYCREILTHEHGCGLEGVLRQRKDDLVGILNGIDLEEWNPETDPLIFRKYTAAAPTGKGVNRKGLQKALGLPQADVPLLGMVSRLTDQKGIDLVVELLPLLAEEDLQLVILGDGDPTFIDPLASAPPEKVKLVTGFFPELAHRIYAGSDIFLMPSRFEPCGLGQMIALRYGTVPVARRTGGLADTVHDAAARDGNGFTFEEYSADAFLEALKRGLETFREDRPRWKKLMKRGMTADFSWGRSAVRYEEIYRRAVAKKTL
jgi:starch synthase